MTGMQNELMNHPTMFIPISLITKRISIFSHSRAATAAVEVMKSWELNGARNFPTLNEERKLNFYYDSNIYIEWEWIQ